MRTAIGNGSGAERSTRRSFRRLLRVTAQQIGVEQVLDDDGAVASECVDHILGWRAGRDPLEVHVANDTCTPAARPGAQRSLAFRPELRELNLGADLDRVTHLQRTEHRRVRLHAEVGLHDGRGDRRS